ncbi:hypothetical protein BDN72DRAFT_961533 [Pluteus cervinus]|uniref:Uncharacterized protein n=1 Tax=Pluteus cervinus TaxID=181527 RepID=A0ACD3AM25_9AGAR|nr:hypothetical protein BDN72DRAFT_961533 [Pluteus cervinus]
MHVKVPEQCAAWDPSESPKLPRTPFDLGSLPRLPPELEFDIFLLTFQGNNKEAKNLILVAKRVFDWLIPHIFNIVRLDEVRPLPTKFNESAYIRYRKHTHHLFIESSSSREYLPLFPNVVDLAFWADVNQNDVPLLLQLPLTRISVAPSPGLFQIFSKVTHLDLLTPLSIDEDLTYLPKLTHLSILPNTSAEMVEFFLDRARCPALKVVIFWGPSEGEFAELDDDEWAQYQAKNSRVVWVKCNPRRDWELGARGGVDMWMFVEGIVASRDQLGL